MSPLCRLSFRHADHVDCATVNPFEHPSAHLRCTSHALRGDACSSYEEREAAQPPGKQVGPGIVRMEMDTRCLERKAV
jgi:hypothetical protein